MSGLRKAALAASLVLMCSALSACQTMEETYAELKDSLSTVEMPSVRAKTADEMERGEEQQMELAETDMKAALFGGVPAQDATIAPASRQEIKVSSNKNCPKVNVVKELSSMHQFSNPDHPSPEQKISSVALISVGTDCLYNENNVAVELDLTFAGKLGPKARVWQTDKPSFAYPYFLAITAPNGTIIAKEVFAATVSYDKDQDSVTHKESLRQIIPLNGQYDNNHEILLGFQLTEGELAYNRALNGTPFEEYDVATPDLMKSSVETAAVVEEEIPAAKPAGTGIGAALQSTSKPIDVIPPHKPEIIAKAPAVEEPAPKPAPEPEEKAEIEAEPAPADIEPSAASASDPVMEESPSDDGSFSETEIEWLGDEASAPETEMVEEALKQEAEAAKEEVKAEILDTVEEVDAEPPAIIDLTAED